MPLDTTTLVIRTRRPWVRRLTWGAAVVLIPLSLYLAYEFGRFDGGYDRLSVSQQRREQEVEIERLERENAQNRARVAELETGRVSQEKEREELSATVAQLQTQVQRQSQDLTFYRGIVSATAGGPPIKVQRFAVLPGSAPRRFKLQLVLIQASKPENAISGTVLMTLEGTEGGRRVTYNLSKLSADGKAQLPFSFRIAQNLDQEVVLPEGFVPGRVSIEVRPSGSSSTPLNQSFNWAVQST